MGTLLGYVGVFVAGVVLDEVFGARLLAKIEFLLARTEARIFSTIRAEVRNLTNKL